MAFSLHAQIGFDVAFEARVECPLVEILDGAHIRVASSQQDIIQDFLFCARPIHRAVQKYNILHQWTADDSAETLLKPARYLALYIRQQMSADALVVCISDDLDLEGVFGGECSNEEFLICAETFHGFAACLCVCRSIPSDVLRWAVA